MPWYAMLFSCAGPVASPASKTTVLNWTRNATTSMSDVTLGEDVGAAATVHKRVQITPPPTSGIDRPEPVVLDVQATVGTARTNGDGFPEQVEVPRTVTATLLRPGAWRTTVACEDRVAVGMPAANAEGLDYRGAALFADCRIELTRGGSNVVALLLVSGDGTFDVRGDGVTLTDP